MLRRVIRVMPHEHKTLGESLSVALQLMERLGERAVTVSKVHLVETIAADDLPAAVFWRAVLHHCEKRATAPAGAGEPRHGGLTLDGAG